LLVGGEGGTQGVGGVDDVGGEGGGGGGLSFPLPSPLPPLRSPGHLRQTQAEL